MAGLPELLASQLGVPVVDGVAAATVMAEGLARLGLPPDHPSPVNTPGADYLDAVALEVN